ncbi:methyltransferase domain-containing protein [Myxococcota bacterium]|nr:methyltransferase domain-containing protein [Myxococcota bacterium]
MSGFTSTIEIDTIKAQSETMSLAEQVYAPALLFALFELGAIRALSEGPMPFEQLHAMVGGDVESLRAVLDAAVALRVLKKRDGKYSAAQHVLTTLGDPSSPNYLGEWVAYLHAMTGPLFELAKVVRSGKPSITYEENLDGVGDERSRAWSALMSSAMSTNAKSRGLEIVDRIDFSSVKTFLDVGSGPGVYSIGICERHTHVKATLLDLPGSLDVAAKNAAASGCSERIELVPGDAMTWMPGRRFDAVLMSNMLHMLGTDAAKALIKHAFDHFVAPGGRLIIQGQLLNDERTSPRWPTLLNLMVRVSTTHGRNHSTTEAKEWMTEAGFTDIELPTCSAFNLNRLVVGRKPA